MTCRVGQMRPMPKSMTWLNDLMPPKTAEQGNYCCLFGDHQTVLIIISMDHFGHGCGAPFPVIIRGPAESFAAPTITMSGAADQGGQPL
jgi:hypothetical protein